MTTGKRPDIGPADDPLLSAVKEVLYFDRPIRGTAPDVH